MASSSGLLNEELQCSICLDVFTDPVTTPCGHNFCRTCLNNCWTNTQTCFCPLCKETFSNKFELEINTTLRKLLQHFKKLSQEKLEVFCDFCDERKQKAVKSCLTCQSSYCGEVEGQQKKNQMVRTQTDVQQMIQNRMEKIQENQNSVETRKPRTVHISNWMIIGLGFLLIAILFALPKQYTVSTDPQSFSVDSRISRAEDLIKVLQQELTELKRNTEAQLLLLQMYSSNEKLTDLKWAHKFAVDVTLDPDTAHTRLILSDDGKQVSLGDIKQDVPENPKRFARCVSVLAKQGFSSGRFYYEVQVKGKTKWSLGVAKESINRKGTVTYTPVNGYWTVILRNENQYKACESPSVSLSLRVKPEIVGVFVDYEEGLVSFYDVGHRSHIYSFTGQTFTEKLYPYFSPCFHEGGKNSKPLIITPVS